MSLDSSVLQTFITILDHYTKKIYLLLPEILDVFPLPHSNSWQLRTIAGLELEKFCICTKASISELHLQRNYL